MSNKFQITNPVWDKVYDAYAWRDNNRTLALVQGEGITIPDGTGINATVTAFRAKAPRFQLKDDRGVIDLSSGDPELSWAIQRPDGSEDIVVCNIVTATSGIIEIPITASATRYAGDVYGEIRLITSNGTTKFYGIGAKVGQGVSDDAAAQATQYSALIAALQKVVSLQTGSVAAMDDLTSGGDLRNGTNPVASGNLKTYLEGNYLNYLGNRFVKMRIAYPDSCTDEQMSGITDGVRMRDSVASDTLYIVRGGTAITNGDFNGVMICAKYRSNSGQQTQYWLTRSGAFQYRTKANDAEDWPETWIKFETTANKDTASLSNSNDKYPSSKLVKDQLDTKENVSNKDTSSLNESNHNTYPSSKLVKTQLDTKENVSNKDTASLNSSDHSTYPSSKLVRTELNLKENIRYAYPDGVSDEAMANITNGARLRDCTSPDTIYLVRGGSDITNGDLIGIMVCTSMQSNNGTQAQFQFTRDGVIKYRTRANTNESWPSTWINFESSNNKVTSLSSSSTNDQYPTAKVVYDAISSCTQYQNPGDSYINNKNNHLDGNTIYKYGSGFVLQASDTNVETQYYFAADGLLRYRVRHKTNGTWEEWPSQFNFSVLETQDNKTTTFDSRSTNNQYPTAKAVFDNTMKYAAITSTQLFDDDTHLDPQTIYRYGAQGLILAATDSVSETQYYFAQDGIMRYRYRVKNGDVWESWVDGNNFYTLINQEDIGNLLSPQNKLDKYFVKTCIDKTQVKLTPKTRILGFGDSIMNRGYGGSWMDVVKNRTGCYTPINKSVGGAQFAVNSGSNTLASQLSSFHSSVNNNTLVDADNHAVGISDINLIIVAGGTNDAYNGIPINNFKTAVDTFFDDLKSEFEDRDLSCPPVLVITPIRRGKESEINAPGNKNLENKIAKYSAVINNLALQYGFSVLNGFDIPVLVDDMTIKGVGSETATISSFMYKTADSGDAYDDILHVHPNPTTGCSTYAQAVIDAIGFEAPNDISVFTYTLNKNSWSTANNNITQSITVPSGYKAYYDISADISIDTPAYNQMLNDGCAGIVVSSIRSGTTLSLTAYAYGAAPTENINISVALVPVVDISV